MQLYECFNYVWISSLLKLAEGRAAENDDDVLRPVCGTATGSQAALGAEWALSEGPDGSRAHLRHVDFPTPFTTQPQVPT